MSDATPGSEGVACMWMRGGTSKGGFFLADDLPDNIKDRDALLLGIMGSPDARQIDGLGGADPLTSKVAVISPSDLEGIDVNYLFLQVAVDRALVSDSQNCGNMLAGVGPFAIERGLVTVRNDQTPVTIQMLNTGQTATANVQTPGGKVTYTGGTEIDGVPGSASAVALTFHDTAGSMCGSLLPTDNVMDVVDGIEVTLIDNGMPTIVLRAEDVAISGSETRKELEDNGPLRERLEKLRLAAGPAMNLGDVTDKTVPKLSIVSRPRLGGTISTRTFIPHRCHASIGVLGAVSVATACLLKGSIAHDLASLAKDASKLARIEHLAGEAKILLETNGAGEVISAAVIRTARKLFDGEVFR